MMRPYELKETVDLMCSSDYKERFYAEYWQTRIRYEKLNQMINNYRDRKLTFTPNCSISLLEWQCDAMCEYLNRLEVRARVENVDLEEM